MEKDQKSNKNGHKKSTLKELSNKMKKYKQFWCARVFVREFFYVTLQGMFVIPSVHFWNLFT